jgi:hypothetical protein
VLLSLERKMISADAPSHRSAAHRQPLCWNFLCHSQIVLSVGGSVWYLVRNLRCVVTIDSFLQIPRHRTLPFPCPRHVSSRLPPGGETCKYAMTPLTQTNLLLSAAPNLVDALPSSEFPEGLTNYPVFLGHYQCNGVH